MKNNINDIHSFNSAGVDEQIQMLREVLLRRLRVAEPTLRDQFAMAAMTGFNKDMVDYGWGEYVLISHAKQAYAVADAMLAAREGKS